jgi:hypothetical protein
MSSARRHHSREARHHSRQEGEVMTTIRPDDLSKLIDLPDLRSKVTC